MKDNRKNILEILELLEDVYPLTTSAVETYAEELLKGEKIPYGKMIELCCEAELEDRENWAQVAQIEPFSPERREWEIRYERWAKVESRLRHMIWEVTMWPPKEEEK